MSVLQTLLSSLNNLLPPEITLIIYDYWQHYIDTMRLGEWKKQHQTKFPHTRMSLDFAKRSSERFNRMYFLALVMYPYQSLQGPDFSHKFFRNLGRWFIGPLNKQESLTYATYQSFEDRLRIHDHYFLGAKTDILRPSVNTTVSEICPKCCERLKYRACLFYNWKESLCEECQASRSLVKRQLKL